MWTKDFPTKYLAFSLVAAFFVALPTTRAWGQSFNKRVIYQIVTDRFFDGNPANNSCPQSPGLYDPTHKNWQLYWGGDLAGIRDKLGYLRKMGVSAIWISPPVDNINVTIPGPNGKPAAPYHGYWARDFMRVDEHFGSCNESWTAFDRLVAAAHADNIKIVDDFAGNHTNPDNAGAFGSLFDNGKFMASCIDDPHGYFHHNPNIQNFNNPYQLQYYTLESLCDLNQENPVIDKYLLSALAKFQRHGVDAFRIDATKHITWGWEYTMVNSIFSNGPSFVFGEWVERVTNPLFNDSVKFANRSGMSLYDYPLGYAIRDVFGRNHSFSEINQTLKKEDESFDFPNKLVTWVDNQDRPRLLSIDDNHNRLNEALAFVLTCRGIPVIYYGDEHYQHNDTNGGNDPYNRPMMSSFSTNTRPFHLIKRLAHLRSGDNDALAYGNMKRKYINPNVYVFQRKFYGDVVLVAINKSVSRSYRISGVTSALPPGHYNDYLNGLMHGFGITVGAGNQTNHPVEPFTLPPNTVSVWVATSKADQPEVGTISPTVGQPGMHVVISGQGFGKSPGRVLVGGESAHILSWSGSSVSFTVPDVKDRNTHVQLGNPQGEKARPVRFTVLAGKLVPVRFTVTNAPVPHKGDEVYLAGNTVSLGDWGGTHPTSWTTDGPMLDPRYPNWFLNVSVPACHTIRFKFLDIQKDGDVVWEKGAPQHYRVPCKGTGKVKVDWQHSY